MTSIDGLSMLSEQPTVKDRKSFRADYLEQKVDILLDRNTAEDAK